MAGVALIFGVGALTATAARAGEPELGALLEKIQRAAQKENYSGTFVHQQNNVVQSSRITHLADKTGEHEKLELLDGQVREFIRHNDDVLCYVPERKLLLVEKRAKYDSFPALLTSHPVDLQSFYRSVPGGVDRIAGRVVQAIRLEPVDGKRFGYRLWYDRDTYLLLKAQTIGDKDALLEQVAFTDVSIGQPVDKARLKPSVSKTDGWRVEKANVTPADLAGAGWSVKDPVPGFRKVMEMRRAFGTRGDVSQMVFSDGLAAISIFIEANPPENAVEGDGEKGPMHVVTRRHGNYWLTVVGDAPAESIRQMSLALDYSAPSK